MAIYNSPALKMMLFRKRAIFPGQVQNSRKTTGELDVVSRGSHLWEGETTWLVENKMDRRAVTRMIFNMQGPINQIRIPMPREYHPVNTPDQNLLLEVSAASKASDGTVTVTYTETGGTWAPTVDDHINIGHRSYVIMEVLPSNMIKVSPLIVPSIGLTIYAYPFVIATITNYDDIRPARSGWKHQNLNVQWREHPFYTDRGGSVVP